MDFLRKRRESFNRWTGFFSCLYRPNFGDVFGVTLVDSVLKGLLARAVVVINESGQVTHTELVDEIANEPNYDAAINSLR